MANTFSEVQEMRKIKAGELRPGQMGKDSVGGIFYRSPNENDEEIILFQRDGDVAVGEESTCVIPLPAGTTITITSEV